MTRAHLGGCQPPGVSRRDPFAAGIAVRGPAGILETLRRLQCQRHGALRRIGRLATRQLADPGRAAGAGWQDPLVFPVGDRSVYPDDLKYYDVEHMAAEFPDPYRFNTFGNLLESPDADAEGRRAARHGQDVRHPHSRADHADAGSRDVDRGHRAAGGPAGGCGEDWEKHCAWWSSFWDRGWIVASDSTLPPEAREKTPRRAFARRRPRRRGRRGAGRRKATTSSGS